MPRGRTPANQAPLALTVDEAPQARIRPEVATPCAAAFDSDEWLFGIDWDGSRATLSVDAAGAVRIDGVMGDLTARFPEVHDAAAALPPGTVLDGVVSILGGDGRPDLAALGARIAGSHRTAAVFLASDLLRAAGVTLLAEPFEARLARLVSMIPEDPHVQAPEPVRTQGVALAQAAASQHLNALLARRRDALYAPGVRSPQRLRIDLSGACDRVVVGRRDTAGGTEVLLGEVVAGRLTYVHTEQLEASAAVLRWFHRTAEPAPSPACADAGAAGRAVTWLRPRLCATLRDSSRPDGPVIAALRDDLDPQWCVRREPVPPPASIPVPPRAFTPTVLRALPLDAA